VASGPRRLCLQGEGLQENRSRRRGLLLRLYAGDDCKAGGEITKRFWVPLGTEDFASVISSLPDDVDAIYLGLGGADAVNFLNQYQQAGGQAPA
jgi:hypothetical protein